MFQRFNAACPGGGPGRMSISAYLRDAAVKALARDGVKVRALSVKETEAA
jgi:hypothetical protein